MDTELIAKLKSRMVVSPSGCWEWQGALATNGYGRVFWRGRLLQATRAMYLAVHGSLPGKVFVCHRCDNPLCINPEHLFAGSPKQNTADMQTKKRHSHGPKHSALLRAAWTPELRAMRAEQTRKRMAEVHLLRTQAAGVPNDWKFCAKCGRWLPREAFHPNAGRHDGLSTRCKPCRSTARFIDPARRGELVRTDRSGIFTCNVCKAQFPTVFMLRSHRAGSKHLKPRD